MRKRLISLLLSLVMLLSLVPSVAWASQVITKDDTIITSFTQYATAGDVAEVTVDIHDAENGRDGLNDGIVSVNYRRVGSGSGSWTPASITDQRTTSIYATETAIFSLAENQFVIGWDESYNATGKGSAKFAAPAEPGLYELWIEVEEAALAPDYHLVPLGQNAYYRAYELFYVEDSTAVGFEDSIVLNEAASWSDIVRQPIHLTNVLGSVTNLDVYAPFVNAVANNDFYTNGENAGNTTITLYCNGYGSENVYVDTSTITFKNDNGRCVGCDEYANHSADIYRYVWYDIASLSDIKVQFASDTDGWTYEVPAGITYEIRETTGGTTVYTPNKEYVLDFTMDNELKPQNFKVRVEVDATEHSSGWYWYDLKTVNGAYPATITDWPEAAFDASRVNVLNNTCSWFQPRLYGEYEPNGDAYSYFTRSFGGVSVLPTRLAVHPYALIDYGYSMDVCNCGEMDMVYRNGHKTVKYHGYQNENKIDLNHGDLSGVINSTEHWTWYPETNGKVNDKVALNSKISAEVKEQIAALNKGVNVLMLDNFWMEYDNSVDGAAMVLPADTVIVLPEGTENKILPVSSDTNVTVSGETYGIAALGDLYIMGEGSLEVDPMKSTDADFAGIHAEGDLTIYDAGVTVTGGENNDKGYGLSADNVVIGGAADVTAVAAKYAIYANNDVVIADTAKIKAEAGDHAIIGMNSVIATGAAEIAATSTDACGIVGYNGVVDLQAASLTVNAKRDGVKAVTSNVVLDVDFVDVTAGQIGILSAKNVEIKNGQLIVDAKQQGVYAKNGNATFTDLVAGSKVVASLTNAIEASNDVYMNNVSMDVETGKFNAVYAGNDVTIEGTTVLTAETGKNGNGIYAVKNVTVDVAGSVTATGHNGVAPKKYAGIFAESGNVTVANGDVYAEAVSANEAKGIFGIYAKTGDVVISGAANVYATGTDVTSNKAVSAGIFAANLVDITTTGKVVAVGGNVNGDRAMSYGIFGDDVNIANADVTATAGTASGTNMAVSVGISAAYGVYDNCTATITDAKVVATGKAATSGNAANRYSAGIGASKYVVIDGASDVTATGVKHGIIAEQNDVTVGGTAKVTAKADGNDGYGIYAKDTVAVNDTADVKAEAKGHAILAMQQVKGAGTAVIAATSTDNCGVVGFHNGVDLQAASLTVNAKRDGVKAAANGNVVLDVALVNITAGDDGVLAVSGSATLTNLTGASQITSASQNAVKAKLTVNVANATFKAEGALNGILAETGNVNVVDAATASASNITAIGKGVGEHKDYAAIKAASGSVTFNAPAATVLASGTDHGIYADDNITGTVGTLTANYKGGATLRDVAPSCGLHANDGFINLNVLGTGVALDTMDACAAMGITINAFNGSMDLDNVCSETKDVKLKAKGNITAKDILASDTDDNFGVEASATNFTANNVVAKGNNVKITTSETATVNDIDAQSDAKITAKNFKANNITTHEDDVKIKVAETASVTNINGADKVTVNAKNFKANNVDAVNDVAIETAETTTVNNITSVDDVTVDAKNLNANDIKADDVAIETVENATVNDIVAKKNVVASATNFTANDVKSAEDTTINAATKATVNSIDAEGKVTTTGAELDVAQDVDGKLGVKLDNDTVDVTGNVLADTGNVEVTENVDSFTAADVIATNSNVIINASATDVDNVTAVNGKVITDGETLTATGTVKGETGVEMTTTTVDVTGDVIATSGSVLATVTNLTAQNIESYSMGDVIIDADTLDAKDVHVGGTNNNAVINAATLASVSNIKADDGTVTTTGAELTVANDVAGAKGVTLSNTTADVEGNVTSSNGDVVVTESVEDFDAENVIAQGKATIKAADSNVNTDVKAGEVVVTNNVESFKAGDVIATATDVTIDAAVAEVDNITAADEVTTSGDKLTVAANVTGAGDVVLNNKTVEVVGTTKGATVSMTNETLASVSDIEASGTVTTTGAKLTAKDVKGTSVELKNAEVTAKDVTASETDVTIDAATKAEVDNITAAGKVTTTGAELVAKDVDGAEVDLKNDKVTADDVNGTTSVNIAAETSAEVANITGGTVTTTGAELTVNEDVTGSTVVLSNATVDVTGKISGSEVTMNNSVLASVSDIEASGTVTTTGAKLTAKDVKGTNVTLNNATTAVENIDGTNVEVNAATKFTANDITASNTDIDAVSGKVNSIKADKDVTVTHTLTVANGIDADGNVTVASGSSLTVSDKGIKADDVTANGGTIEAKNTSGNGIDADNVTANSGTITATGKNIGINAVGEVKAYDGKITGNATTDVDSELGGAVYGIKAGTVTASNTADGEAYVKGETTNKAQDGFGIFAGELNVAGNDASGLATAEGIAKNGTGIYVTGKTTLTGESDLKASGANGYASRNSEENFVSGERNASMILKGGLDGDTHFLLSGKSDQLKYSGSQYKSNAEAYDKHYEQLKASATEIIVTGNVNMNHSTTFTKTSGGASGGVYIPGPAVVTEVTTNMPMLRKGNTGDAVKVLQTKLNSLGYNCGAVDGVFGNDTYNAVVKYQQAMGISVDGVVGSQTWAKLGVGGTVVTVAAATNVVSTVAPATSVVSSGMPMLRKGNTGDAVKTLQTKLNALGYDCGTVDGVFGNNTYNAVVKFQTAMGIGVDGVVGAQTWAKLG